MKKALFLLFFSVLSNAADWGPVSNINALMSGLATFLGTQETSFLSANGYYFQGAITNVPTLATLPNCATGTPIAPTTLAAFPSAQTSAWTSLVNTWNGTSGFGNGIYAIAVNVLNGPSGVGYQIVGVFNEGGVIMWKAIVVGANTDFSSFDWTAFPLPP